MTSRSTHVLNLLSEHLDGTLPPQQRQEVEQHLRQCSECQTHWTQLQEQRAALKKSPSLNPPESFYRSVWERIDGKVTPRLSWTWNIGLKAMATACLLAVVVLVAREGRPPSVQVPTDTAEVDQLAADKGMATTHSAPTAGPTLADKEISSTGNGSPVLSGKIDVAQPIPALQKNKSANNELARSPAPLPPGTYEQARDINGASSQGSFMREKKAATRTSSVDQPMAAAAVGGIVQDWKGSMCGISEFRTVVIQNETDWRALWAEMHQTISGPAIPMIDFSQWTLVGIFEGPKPSTGYAVTLTQIVNNADSITVDYQTQSPPPGLMAAAILTQPYHLRLIPKTTLPIHFVQIPS